MKNFLKKLHIMPDQPESTQGSTSSRGNNNNKSNDVSSSDRTFNSRSHHNSKHKPFSKISGWLNSVANRHGPNESRDERLEPSDSDSSSDLDVVLDSVRNELEKSELRGDQDTEEYQIKLALEMSAREDPEAVQIESVKQISLGTCDPHNTPAEVIAFRYWNYNSLSYDDKIMDGFYDLYGILNESNSERMPSLVDLQGTLVSEGVIWEAVLVNRAADEKLLKIEQSALEMAIKSRPDSLVCADSNLVQKLALLVSNHMGGPVGNPEKMARQWRSHSYGLKVMLGSMVLPLGSLTIGFSRHRALLFKLLADGVGIPCRLVKGQQYTGSDNVAINFVKLDDGREYIVDLMADPGTLIPSDVAGSRIEYDESLFSPSPLSRDIDSYQMASSSSGVGSSYDENSDFGASDRRSRFSNFATAGKESEENEEYIFSKRSSDNVERVLLQDLPSKPNFLFRHGRSPSWTEGVSSPAVHRMKVKDASQYMIDAAKGNPQFAQKLHDALLESGLVAPPDLFTEMYSRISNVESNPQNKGNEDITKGIASLQIKGQDDSCPMHALPPLPPKMHLKPSLLSEQPQDLTPGKNLKNVPVAAAAAAAAVVASSMVVAAAKSSSNANLQLPVAAAAAVVATTAAVSRQYEWSEGDVDSGSGGHGNDSLGGNSEGDRLSYGSTGNRSTKSDVGLDDVAECEIQWEDITLGERIGLGSYGEVYHGAWLGTEVAVKRFLDQDITGELLEEFKSEVRIMKRLRHPNIVLFMGAVTHTPNFSIVTEFLPRGSLYRIIHRPNNQLDERRRLRMALDAARGMNYLHNCTPVIVHRDLKSPNLLVDKNWVVKVCDFGLSRIKYSTFLSSRSAAGTAEWMAPEVLRNEPLDEKCDVYSFGVILWELCTMQQPWGGMNPMQVVGAVGFQHRRLDIPEDTDPAIADIIRKCWQTDPKLRPTFAEIMAALKPLQKPIMASQASRPSAQTGSGNENAQ